MTKSTERNSKSHANGQGSVGKGGQDKRGRPLRKDGQPDHRIKSEK